MERTENAGDSLRQATSAETEIEIIHWICGLSAFFILAFQHVQFCAF